MITIKNSKLRTLLELQDSYLSPWSFFACSALAWASLASFFRLGKYTNMAFRNWIICYNFLGNCYKTTSLRKYGKLRLDVLWWVRTVNMVYKVLTFFQSDPSDSHVSSEITQCARFEARGISKKRQYKNIFSQFYKENTAQEKHVLPSLL